MSRTKSVLLVDDDEEFRHLVRPSLLARGLTIVDARSAREGTEKLAGGSFDLIIVDGLLPDLDGVVWITKVRATGNTTPVIFVSSTLQDVGTYRHLTKNLAVAQVLHKPIIPAVFAEQVTAELAAPVRPEVVEEHPVTPADPALQELSTEYMQMLPSSLAEVERTLAELKVPGQPPDMCRRVRTLSHKIRGTAGSFGLHRIGEAMGVIDDILRSTGDLPQSISNDQWLRIEESLQLAKTLLPESVPARGLPRSRPMRARVPSDGKAALSRILVVDPDTRFLEFISRVGRQRLVDVVPASSSQEALDKAKILRIDAAIINTEQGSHKEAVQLAHDLRELPDHQQIPLAFISSNADLYDRVTTAHAGASLFLSKPIEPDAFEDAVQRLVALRKVGQARVLIVDDDEFFARHVAEVLADKGLDTQILTQPSSIIEVIHEFNPDILLLDLVMPDISGLDVCRILRNMPRWQDLPIVFITAQTGLDTRISAYDCGADDYLPKPMADEELISRVMLRVERAKLLRERTERDSITGLLLRRSFMERLNASLSSARRHHQNLGLALLDIDHFKEVNDTHGHLSGDAVLAGLGRLLSRRFRVEDLRGRWGGDEFVIAFYASSLIHSARTISNLLQDFGKMTFPSDGGKIFSSSLSAGIAAFPDDGDTVYDLIRVADRRLYTAKGRGRDTIVYTD